MKSIEERAREYADRNKHVLICDWNDFYTYKVVSNAEMAAYERGATEQKAIDNALWLKKAYKWIKENVEGGVHPQSAYGFADRFLKAMKE